MVIARWHDCRSPPCEGQMGGGDIATVVTTIVYDALARRIRLTEYDDVGAITEDTVYYYDGQRVLAELDYDESAGTQTLARYFVDGPLYVDEHVLMHDAATGADYHYLLRELYSVAGQAEASGAACQETPGRGAAPETPASKPQPESTGGLTETRS